MQRLGLLCHSRSFEVTKFGTNQKLIYDFVLVINTNLPPILHRFWDIAFDRSKVAIFGYPSCIQPSRRRGSPGKISVKFYLDVDGWPRYRIAKKYYQKFQPAEQGARTLQTIHDRQRDGWAMTYSKRQLVC